MREDQEIACDGTRERTSPEIWIISDTWEPVIDRIIPLDDDIMIREATCEATQHDMSNTSHIHLSERMIEDDIIDTIQELRSEVSAKFCE
jgi:hypothetical protein